MVVAAIIETGAAALDIFEAAFDIWNDFYKTSYELLTQDPSGIFGGALWSAVTSIVYGLQAFGYALFLCFLYMGLLQSINSYTEIKKPTVVIRFVLRAILTKYAIDYGPTLFLNILRIFIGIIQQASSAASGFYNSNGLATYGGIDMSDRIAERIESASTLGGLVYCVIALITWIIFLALSLVIVLTVFGRIFRIMVYAAISPLPLSAFAGEPTSFVGKNFIKSYVGVCAEGLVIALCCIIFNIYVGTSGQNYLDGKTVQKVYNVVVNENRVELTLNPDYERVGSSHAGTKLIELKEKWSSYCSSQDGNDRIVYVVSSASMRQELINDYNALTFTSYSGGGGTKGVMLYIGRCIFMMLILCGSVKGADMMTSRMFGL